MNPIENEFTKVAEQAEGAVLTTEVALTRLPVIPRQPHDDRSESSQWTRDGEKLVRTDAASGRLSASHINARTKARAAVEAAEAAEETTESMPQPAGPETDTIPVPGQPIANPPVQGWGDVIGVVDTHTVDELGIGDVRDNDSAFQSAAQEMAAAETIRQSRLAEAKDGQRNSEETVSRRDSGLTSTTRISLPHFSAPVKTGGTLNIQPAWEVDYFRWPRLSRKLLETHYELFEQIGKKVLGDLQPTQQRIGVCSTFPREGKTTIATCLARWSAESGRRTLLLDADIQRPKMSLMCGLDCVFGWQSLLDADLPISETMIRSSESGLVFMPSRTGATFSPEDKMIEQLSRVTFQLKYEFDVVVIDLGSVDGICAHGAPNMDLVDAAVVTRDPSLTSVGQVMDTRKKLEQHGVRRTYVAQNFARSTPVH